MRAESTTNLTALRHLVTTTCLTIGPIGAAIAGTIVEGTPPAPVDFPDTFPGYLLPVGTTTVLGSLSSDDLADWFTFQGLTGSFSVNAFWPAGAIEQYMRYAVFDTSGSQLASGTLEVLGGVKPPLTGTVPADGEIVVGVYHPYVGSFEGFSQAGVGALEGSSPPSVGYQVDVTTPEPTSLALLSLPAAGLLAWRRRKAS